MFGSIGVIIAYLRNEKGREAKITLRTAKQRENVF
jgi:hypothetical protein